MKRMKLFVALLVLCSSMLVGCAHEHEWKYATCTEPKTCTTCGETEGSATGHEWVEATCLSAKKCAQCGTTEGEPLVHKWINATCTKSQYCSLCGTVGEKELGHDIEKINCTEDSKCKRCNEIIPAPGHNLSEATCTKAPTCKTCNESVGKALGHSTDNGTCARCGDEVYKAIIGTGDDVISNVSVGDGMYRISITNSGHYDNFIVKAYNKDGSTALLVNEIGMYDGYVYLSGEGPYDFEIQYSGSWIFQIEKIGDTTKSEFSGKGDYVTDRFSTSTGTWQFTHDGSRNFVVKAYTTDGIDLLVNEIGSYNGKKIVKVPNGSKVMFVINADGNWTAKPVK